MFCARFPLAALTAFATNMVEIRFDAHKFLITRRPAPEMTRDIGVWFPIMQLISLMAVITNVTIIFLSTTPADEQTNYTSSLTHLFPSMGNAGPIVAAVVMEHLLIALKWVLRVILPDTPTSVIDDEFRERYAAMPVCKSVSLVLLMTPCLWAQHAGTS